MTEKELRQKVADAITSWVGATKGSTKHKEILAIYNGHKPLARGYTVKTTDAYCATTVSAAYIKAGIAEYTGTECGVEKYVEIAKGLASGSRTTHTSRGSATPASMTGTTPERVIVPGIPTTSASSPKRPPAPSW